MEREQRVCKCSQGLLQLRVVWWLQRAPGGKNNRSVKCCHLRAEKKQDISRRGHKTTLERQFSSYAEATREQNCRLTTNQKKCCRFIRRDVLYLFCVVCCVFVPPFGFTSAARLFPRRLQLFMRQFEKGIYIKAQVSRNKVAAGEKDEHAGA